MNKWYPSTARAVLTAVLVLSGHTAAFGQGIGIGKLGQLPNVHLGLGKVGVEAILIPGNAAKAASPLLPALFVPAVTVRVAPPILPGTDVSVGAGGGGVGGSVTVPSIGGLTPPLGVDVNVNTGGPGPLVAVGGVGETADAPPNQSALDLAAVARSGGPMAERSLDLVPTCR